MQISIWIFVAAAFILGSFGCASGTTIHNSKSDFENFLDTPMTGNDFLRGWGKFEKRYQEIYEKLFPQKDPEAQKRKLAQLEKLRLAMPSLRAKMLQFYNRSSFAINEQLTRFKNKFPDLKDKLSIYLIPSLLTFNGKVFQLGNSEVFLLGVDQIVQQKDDLDVLFSHELFHIYHSSKITNAKNWNTFSFPLWTEGMATYMSGQLNPGKPDSVLLMDSNLAKDCENKFFVAKLAQDYLAIVDKTNTDNNSEKIYSDWYLKRGTCTPVRSGYCLGLQVIRTIVQTHEIREMMSWGEGPATDRIKSSLQKLAATD